MTTKDSGWAAAASDVLLKTNVIGSGRPAAFNGIISQFVSSRCGVARHAKPSADRFISHDQRYRKEGRIGRSDGDVK